MRLLTMVYTTKGDFADVALGFNAKNSRRPAGLHSHFLSYRGLVLGNLTNIQNNSRQVEFSL